MVLLAKTTRVRAVGNVAWEGFCRFWMRFGAQWEDLSKNQVEPIQGAVGVDFGFLTSTTCAEAAWLSRLCGLLRVFDSDELRNRSSGCGYRF